MGKQYNGLLPKLLNACENVAPGGQGTAFLELGSIFAYLIPISHLIFAAHKHGDGMGLVILGLAFEEGVILYPEGGLTLRILANGDIPQGGKMHYILSFLEGIITFISPCLLPMLPVYIAYFAGNEKKPLGNAIGFVAGFTIIFIALGALAGVVGSFLVQYSAVINIVAGAIIILLGLGYLGVIQLPVLNRRSFRPAQNVTFLSSIVFGIVFAVTWTPCAGVFLGTALLRASTQGSAVDGMFMLFLFSMGLGLPFVVSAVLINRLKTAFDFIKRHYQVINAIAGGMLLVVGVLIATGIFGRYLALFI